MDDGGTVTIHHSDARDLLLLLFAALLWGWLIEGLTRLVLPGYGLALGGPALEGVPLAAGALWSLLWFGVALLRDPRAGALAAVAGATALGWLGGAGWLALLFGPAVALGYCGVLRTVARIDLPPPQSHRLRLLITIILLGIVALVYIQWLWLITWVLR